MLSVTSASTRRGRKFPEIGKLYEENPSILSPPPLLLGVTIEQTQVARISELVTVVFRFNKVHGSHLSVLCSLQNRCMKQSTIAII